MPNRAPPRDPPIDNSPAAVALRSFHCPSATARQREAAARDMLNAYRPWINAHLRQWRRARPEDIEDALSEALRRFYERVPADHPAPQAALRLIFKHVIIDQHDRWVRHEGASASIDAVGPDGEPLLQVSAHAASSDPAEIAWRRDLLDKLQALVGRRSAKDRRTLQRLAQGDSAADIARDLNCECGAARERISKLRRYLRRALSLDAPGDLK